MLDNIYISLLYPARERKKERKRERERERERKIFQNTI